MSISREEAGRLKAALRSRLLQDRKALLPNERGVAERAIGRALTAEWRARGWLALSTAPSGGDDDSSRSPRPAGGPRSMTLAVYWPIRGEPDLQTELRQWRAAGMALALPVTPAEKGPLRFADWREQTVLARDAFGIYSPAQPRWVTPDALLIPCVGFDARGYRLGYGGGYYDRTLATFGGPSIGVGFARGLLDDLPHETHDLALTAIVTEARVYRS